MVAKFGPKKLGPAERVPFDFTFMRGDYAEEHHFQIVARLDAAGLATAMILTKKAPEEALGGILSMMNKMLDNSDGTPARWSPAPLPLPEPPAGPTYGDWPATSGDAEGDDQERVEKFRAPDGSLYPMDQAAKFLEHSAGSSRRRWQHIINEDDELVVDLEALMSLFEWAVGMAGGRPTQPSA